MNKMLIKLMLINRDDLIKIKFFNERVYLV